MDKEKVYKNIYIMINGGLFLEKYMELTENIDLNEYSEEKIEYLENKAANIFNAILIGCQLFDDNERILKFINMFSSHIEPQFLERFLPSLNITEEEALERLKHGFGVHFTTVKICDEIKKRGWLIGYGKNAMFTDEEDMIINQASKEQRENDPESKERLNYLFRGFGTGVSSYGSLTNGFWMYHTPESLSFLFGNISRRNKKKSMECVSKNISALSEKNKEIVFNVMSNIYDRLIGEEQEIGCILIDRDAFEYEIDYYYNTGEPVAVERRPYSKDLNDLMSNDSKINTDINVSGLKFLKIPTIIELERQKLEKFQSRKSQHR